jgi:hypothetical protein
LIGSTEKISALDHKPTFALQQGMFALLLISTEKANPKARHLPDNLHVK